MMDRYTMVVLIVLIVMTATVLKARFSGRRRSADDAAALANPAEVRRMEEEMRGLRERIVVLERIVTDRNHGLEHEIERLRDR